jgi:hypothetical protein
LASAEKDQHSAKQQGEKYAGKDRNSNILPFSAVCDPAGKTGKRGEYIDGKQLKQALDHMVIIGEMKSGLQKRPISLPIPHVDNLCLQK